MGQIRELLQFPCLLFWWFRLKYAKIPVLSRLSPLFWQTMTFDFFQYSVFFAKFDSVLKSSSSSVAIHDNWESSSVALLCALIDKSPEQLIIIVRNKKEQRLYPQHANFIIWPLGERPPNLDNYRHFWWSLFWWFLDFKATFRSKGRLFEIFGSYRSFQYQQKA